MPVVSMDKKVNKFADWTIEKQKYLKPVETVSKRLFRPLTGSNKYGRGKRNKLIELEELRRRTLTADGVVDSRSGKIVGAKDINLKVLNEEWDKRNRVGLGAVDEGGVEGGEGGDRNEGGGGAGGGDGGLGLGFSRNLEHRRR